MKQTWVGIVLLLLCCVLGCTKKGTPRLYQVTPIAPSYSEADVRNLEHLGAHIVDRGVSFNVYSQNATRVELLIFEDPESTTPDQIFAMYRFGDVWSIYVEGIGKGTYYGYRAWGPNWPYDPTWRPGTTIGYIADVDTLGNRFNPNKLLMDPYARAFHRDHDWSRGSAGSGPYRAESTIAAAAKSIVVQEGEYVWSAEEQNK